jgi:2'-5' RNA ligase
MNYPIIIWTGIETSEKLNHLNDIIVNGLKTIDVKPDDRPFNPHLTLGRIKHLNNKAALKTLIDRFKNIEFQIIPVTEVILYESILSQSGPLYKTVSFFKL